MYSFIQPAFSLNNTIVFLFISLCVPLQGWHGETCQTLPALQAPPHAQPLCPCLHAKLSKATHPRLTCAALPPAAEAPTSSAPGPQGRPPSSPGPTEPGPSARPAFKKSDLIRYGWMVRSEFHQKRLKAFVLEKLPQLSPPKMAYLLERGLVRVNGITEDIADFQLSGGDLVDILVPYGVLMRVMPQQKVQLDIIYEDQHLLVINKPATVCCHPNSSVFEETLLNGILAHYKLPPVEPSIDGRVPQTLHEVAEVWGTRDLGAVRAWGCIKCGVYWRSVVATGQPASHGM